MVARIEEGYASIQNAFPLVGIQSRAGVDFSKPSLLCMESPMCQMILLFFPGLDALYIFFFYLNCKLAKQKSPDP